MFELSGPLAQRVFAVPPVCLLQDVIRMVSSRAQNQPVRPPLLDESAGRSPFAPLPSWLASVIAHAAVFFLLATTLRGCGAGRAGTTEAEQYREVGIYVREAREQPEPIEVMDQTDGDDRAADRRPLPVLEQQPPVELTLPETPAVSVAGPSVPRFESIVPGDVREMITPSSVRPAGQPTPGRGTVSFLDIRDAANRFVYLIDCSGSMAGPPIRYAREQLKASIQNLTKTQQFQILFYNERAHAMSLKPRPNTGMYRATPSNIAAATRFIDSWQPDSGTDHAPAIKAALRLRPEVIYLLTDGTEPRLAAGDRDRIRRLNRGGTRIHCIEFGKGGPLDIENWVEKMALQNDGVYQYRDVTRLTNR